MLTYVDVDSIYVGKSRRFFTAFARVRGKKVSLCCTDVPPLGGISRLHMLEVTNNWSKMFQRCPFPL